jgi:hypothetical protein
MQTYNQDEMLDDRKVVLEQWSTQIEQLMANK